MAHEYKKEADASHERKLKSYGAKTSSTADKLDDKDDATNWAGFRALNTNKQAGMSPLNKKASMSEETNPRIMRKKGGRVSGAESLKRLDKAPRKGKSAGPTGTRKGPIPSPMTEQEEFDVTLRTNPGEMSEGTTRKSGGKVQDYESRSHESQGAQGKRPYEGHKKGGRVAKASGGPLEQFINDIFGDDETPEAAVTRRSAPAAHRAAPRAAPRPAPRPRTAAVEPYRAMAADVPLPPRRPAELMSYADPGAIENMHRRSADPRGTSSSALETTAETYGNAPVKEADMDEFYRGQGIGVRPSPAMSADSSTEVPFFARELYNRKDGGRLVRAKGGKAEHPDEAEDKALIRKMVKKEDLKMKDGGRAKRASGGGAFDDYMGGSSEGSSRKGSSGKGKTTVNIMIGQPQGGPPGGGIDPMLMAALAGAGGGGGPQQLPPPAPPGGAPVGAPPPAAMMAPPAGPPGPPPGAGGPPMPRKDGGKVQVPYRKPSRKDDYPAMDFGSGGGFGRKQKVDSYGTKGPSSKDNY